MAVYSERTGNSFGPNGFSIDVSSSKYPKSHCNEGDEPDVLADLRDADALAGEDMTEIHLASAEADPTAAGDHDRLVVKGVRQLLKTAVEAGGARKRSAGTFMPSAWCGRSML